MKARVKIQAKIGGINYTVNAGETIPPALAAFYTAENAVDALVKTGVIETEAKPIEAVAKKKD